MKTIFINIPMGIIARNILRTDVLKLLKTRKDLRIVLILPRGVEPYFREEIERDNVIVEEQRGKARAGIFRHFILYPLMQNLVYTNTSRLLFRYGTSNNPRNTPIRYFLSFIIFAPLSKLTVSKRFCRWIDFHFFKPYDSSYEELFDYYQPSLVFATDVLLGPVDRVLLRTARRRGIPTVGMVKSWDNLDKNLIVVLPDIFLVWNEKMRQDLIEFQDFGSRNIVTTGIPQFDIYTKPQVFLTRKEYCRQMGFDPNKKILLLGSGFVSLYDAEIVAILSEFIEKGELREECQVLIRPHYLESGVKTSRFAQCADYPNVVLDKADRTNNFFAAGGWDPSYEDMVHLANHFRHCDILITFSSTLSLDASFFDKPIINIAFDGLKQRHISRSNRRGLKTSHYRAVLDTGGVRVVYSKEELREAINQYLEDPSLYGEGREMLRQKLCYKLDGRSAQRIAESVLNIL